MTPPRARAIRTAGASGLAILAALTLAPAARADEDGAYGRLDADLGLRLEAGATFHRGGPSFSALTSAIYLDTAGIYASYFDALRDGPDARRSIAAGVRVQPLFLARYFKNMERGPAHLDLLIDSLALDVGAFWAQGRDHFEATPGMELGVGIALPFIGDASGPVVSARGAVRLATAEFDGSRGEAAGFFTVAIGWRQLVHAHLADAGDRLAR